MKMKKKELKRELKEMELAYTQEIELLIKKINRLQSETVTQREFIEYLKTMISSQNGHIAGYMQIIEVMHPTKNPN